MDVGGICPSAGGAGDECGVIWGAILKGVPIRGASLLSRHPESGRDFIYIFILGRKFCTRKRLCGCAWRRPRVAGPPMLSKFSGFLETRGIWHSAQVAI